MKKKQMYFALILGLMILSFLIRVLTPLADPSEARYANVSKNIVQLNNYVTPHIWRHGKLIPFLGKPPLGFWAMAGSIELFGANEFAVRFPQFVASLLLLILMFYILKRYKGVYNAVNTVLITATASGFWILSTTVLIDMWLCLFSIGAVFLYYAFIQETDRKIQKRLSLLIFFFLGCSFLTKGPVGLVYFGLPVFFWTLFSGRWDTLKNHAWFTGLALFLLVVIPWFILVEQENPGFCKYFFVHENFKRFTTTDYGDLYSGATRKTPRGTAILTAALVCLPWSLLLVIIYSIKKKSALAVLAPIKQGLINIKDFCLKYKKHDFDLFMVGTIAIALFWAASSHLRMYYLILLTPLFGAWCANVFEKYRVSYKTVIKFTVSIMIIYVIAGIPILLAIKSRKSTKNIMQKAIVMRDAENLGGKIIFVRTIPHSAYFYGEEFLLTHPKEPVSDSLIRSSVKAKDFANTGVQDLYILKTKYLKEISEEETNSLKIVDKYGKWTIALRIQQEKSQKKNK